MKKLEAGRSTKGDEGRKEAKVQAAPVEEMSAGVEEKAAAVRGSSSRREGRSNRREGSSSSRRQGSISRREGSFALGAERGDGEKEGPRRREKDRQDDIKTQEKGKISSRKKWNKEELRCRCC